MIAVTGHHFIPNGDLATIIIAACYSSWSINYECNTRFIWWSHDVYDQVIRGARYFIWYRGRRRFNLNYGIGEMSYVLLLNFIFSYTASLFFCVILMRLENYI